MISKGVEKMGIGVLLSQRNGRSGEREMVGLVLISVGALHARGGVTTVQGVVAHLGGGCRKPVQRLGVYNWCGMSTVRDCGVLLRCGIEVQ